MLGKLTQDTLIFDWSKFHPRAALVCIPAVALPLIIGIGTGHATQGMMATAGAFSVGFGSFQELRHSRLAPMLVAAIGMCISSWIGTLAGLSSIATILVSAIWGLLYGTVWTLSPGTAWTALQCLIWLVISTAFPRSGLQALTRGSFVLAGGLLQVSFVLALWRIQGKVTPVAGGSSTPEESRIVSHAMNADWSRRLQAHSRGHHFGNCIGCLPVSVAAYWLLDPDDGCHRDQARASSNFSTRNRASAGNRGGGSIGYTDRDQSKTATLDFGRPGGYFRRGLLHAYLRELCRLRGLRHLLRGLYPDSGRPSRESTDSAPGIEYPVGGWRRADRSRYVFAVGAKRGRASFL